ncbi:hypothetical protein ACH5RR_009764 [Cinchona calisaya]|uniref:Uncharacterized protein n=1 Tax=Cinchona calisaya TaxID=153742 RepID=A0ABD3AFD8_9GENT
MDLNEAVVAVPTTIAATVTKAVVFVASPIATAVTTVTDAVSAGATKWREAEEDYWGKGKRRGYGEGFCVGGRGLGGVDKRAAGRWMRRKRERDRAEQDCGEVEGERKGGYGKAVAELERWKRKRRREIGGG